jgi:hypothetical protein
MKLAGVKGCGIRVRACGDGRIGLRFELGQVGGKMDFLLYSSAGASRPYRKSR